MAKTVKESEWDTTLALVIVGILVILLWWCAPPLPSPPPGPPVPDTQTYRAGHDQAERLLGFLI